MDHFFNEAATVGTTGLDMISIANAAGFTFALKSDVEELLNSLPLGGGEWNSYASAMGFGIPRQLIWGMYDDGNGPAYGWAWSYSSDPVWNLADDIADPNIVQNEGRFGSVDLGIFAYKSGVANVPDSSSTLALLSLSLATFVIARRKK